MSANINKDRRYDADTSYDKRDIQSYDGDQSRDIGKDRVYDYDNTAEAGAKYGINKDNAYDADQTLDSRNKAGKGHSYSRGWGSRGYGAYSELEFQKELEVGAIELEGGR